MGTKMKMVGEQQRNLVSPIVCGLLYLACCSKEPTTRPVAYQVRCLVAARESQVNAMSLYIDMWINEYILNFNLLTPRSD